MKTFNASHAVYSPRWGHPDVYTITMSDTEMTVSQGGRVSKCVIGTNGDPKWSGGGEPGNPLMYTFGNDKIFVSDVVPAALQSAWQKWRESEVTEDVLRAGVKELFDWIDATARSKPHGELWRGVF